MKQLGIFALNIVCAPALILYLAAFVLVAFLFLKLNINGISRPSQIITIADGWLFFCEKTYFTLISGALLWVWALG